MVFQCVKKSLAEFAARRRQRNKIIFSRDMCVRENTSQAASVEFLRTAQKLCAQQTVSLLSEKPGGFFDSLKYHRIPTMVFFLQAVCRQGGGQSSSAAASSAVAGSIQSTMVATQRLMFFPSP